MTILVAYGTSRQGTAGLAEMIAEAFVRLGRGAVAVPARAAGDPTGYEAVVVAGSLSAGRWHRDARRWVRSHAAALRATPTWLVTSGPLDDSARGGAIPPVPHVAAAMDLVRARGHMTFGGCLAPDARGFPAAAMARTRAGDWRDPDHVREWVASVDAELSAL